MKKWMQKIKKMPLQPSAIFSYPCQISQSAFFPSETASVLKAREWPRGWQMPGLRAAQTLQMPHPRD